MTSRHLSLLLCNHFPPISSYLSHAPPSTCNMLYVSECFSVLPPPFPSICLSHIPAVCTYHIKRGLPEHSYSLKALCFCICLLCLTLWHVTHTWMHKDKLIGPTSQIFIYIHTHMYHTLVEVFVVLKECFVKAAVKHISLSVLVFGLTVPNNTCVDCPFSEWKLVLCTIRLFHFHSKQMFCVLCYSYSHSHTVVSKHSTEQDKWVHRSPFCLCRKVSKVI